MAIFFGVSGRQNDRVVVVVVGETVVVVVNGEAVVGMEVVISSYSQSILKNKLLGMSSILFMEQKDCGAGVVVVGLVQGSSGEQPEIFPWNIGRLIISC